MKYNKLDLVRQGIELCRTGSWNEGLTCLKSVAEAKDEKVELPGIFYSYLGYGIALCQHRYREGLRLCEHAVKKDFFEPDNFLNLARTRMLRENRRPAVKAVRRGLKVDPNHDGLLELQRELGIRRSPVLPFLARTNSLNIALGRLRHKIRP